MMILTMTPTMTAETDAPRAGELCLMLAEYAGWLLGSGATCLRLEKNVSRIAAAYGWHAELSINPRHVHVALFGADRTEMCATMASARPAPVSFAVITSLSRLSWLIADRQIDFEQARRAMQAVVGARGPLASGVVLLLVALAGSAFCRLFGGDAAAMGVVGVATYAGFFLKQRLQCAGTDSRVVMLVCAFVSAVLGCSDALFGLGSTPQISAATSVLYLVPGVPYLNSFSDMLCRYYICAVSRLLDAVILTACLSAGLCGAMLLMGANMF